MRDNQGKLTVDYYLTPELKSYYAEDFRKLQKITDPYWKLDSGVVVPCKKINDSFNFVTIFSKNSPYLNSVLQVQSYVRLAFTEKGESLLNDKIIPHLNAVFLDVDNFIFNFKEPDDNETSDAFDIGCFKNPDYFRVHSILFELTSDDEEDHNLFWSSISSIISEY